MHYLASIGGFTGTVCETQRSHRLAETVVFARRWFSDVAQTWTFRGDERERDIDFAAVGSGVS